MVVVQWITAAAFALLAVIAVRFAIQRPGTLTRWAAVASSSIAALTLIVPLGAQLQQDSLGWRIVTIASNCLLAVFPWALYRMSRTVTPASKVWTRWVADLSFAALLAATLIFTDLTTFPESAFSVGKLLFTIAFIAEVVTFPIVAGVKLLASSRGQSLVVTKRLRTLGFATLLLSAALIVSLTGLGNSEDAMLLVQLAGLASAGMFVTALLAPAPLRRYWNMPNETAINAAIGETLSISSAEESIGRLLPPVAATCGSKTAAYFNRSGHPVAVTGISATEAARRLATDGGTSGSGSTLGGDPLDSGRIAVATETGRLVVWTNALWPFPSDDEQRQVVNVGGMIDLLVTRRDADEIHRQLEIRQLVEQSLRDQAGELERVNAELNQFVAVASHDLQAPMRNIIDYVDFLREDLGDELSEAATEDLHFITTAAARMRELIEALLSYTRVGNANLPLSQQVSMDSVVSDTLDTLAFQLSDVGAEVTVAPDLPRLQGDPTTLTQLMVNLLENCVKYRNRERPLTVSVSWAEHDDFYLFSVTDNGEGVPEEFQSRIFTMFKRLHTEEDIPGTGIGLAICQRIVERHGGNIWVQESSDDGTTISFNLAKRHASPDQSGGGGGVADVREAHHLVSGGQPR